MGTLGACMQWRSFYTGWCPTASLDLQDPGHPKLKSAGQWCTANKDLATGQPDNQITMVDP